MTREETVKYLYDLLKKHSVKVNEVDVIPVSSCIALVDEVINHEQDTLKEFVEWLKGRFDKRIDEQTAKYERIVNEGDDGDYLTSYSEYVANNEGILTGFVNAKWWLEELDTIEKFLEDRNDKGKNN